MKGEKLRVTPKTDKKLIKIIREIFPGSEISVGYAATLALMKKAAKNAKN